MNDQMVRSDPVNNHQIFHSVPLLEDLQFVMIDPKRVADDAFSSYDA